MARIENFSDSYEIGENLGGFHEKIIMEGESGKCYQGIYWVAEAITQIESMYDLLDDINKAVLKG